MVKVFVAALLLGVAVVSGVALPIRQSAAQTPSEISQLREKAELAQFNLGFMYANGQGVLLLNNVEALKQYRRDAEQGDAAAQYILGLMYFNGVGLPQDNLGALKWWRLAAEQGLAKAQFILGWMYTEGVGVKEDHTDAVKWFRLAADQGLAAAQFSLGAMYADGRGVPQNDSEAYFWSLLAAASSETRDKGGLELRNWVSARLTPEERTAVQKRAADWYAKATGSQLP